MATPVITQHDDMIHDAQFDYYGKRLATCSSDRTIKIFEVAADGTASTKVADLKRHEGPVWQVAWAHPRFGSLLASCSYDRRVIIWKEETQNNWIPVHEYTDFSLSVNSVAWAPQEYGLALACASADGQVAVLTWREDDTWVPEKWHAHRGGVNAVSWAPALQPGSLLAQAASASALGPRRLATAGCDNLIRVWVRAEGAAAQGQAQWSQQSLLEEHKDWVRDVAWAPNIGLAYSTLASCSQDCTVVVWSQDAAAGGAWTKKVLPKFPDVVWRVSWSVTGNILAVSGGDNKVTLWKESVEGEWKCVSTMDEPVDQAPQPAQ